jgi:hypothetical protein
VCVRLGVERLDPGVIPEWLPVLADGMAMELGVELPTIDRERSAPAVSIEAA